MRDRHRLDLIPGPGRDDSTEPWDDINIERRNIVFQFCFKQRPPKIDGFLLCLPISWVLRSMFDVMFMDIPAAEFHRGRALDGPEAGRQLGQGGNKGVSPMAQLRPRRSTTLEARRQANLRPSSRLSCPSRHVPTNGFV